MEASSSNFVPTSAVLHEKLLTGRNGVVSGNPGVILASSAEQRLSQQMDVNENPSPVGVATVVGDHKHSGPITSTPQVSPEILVREMNMNEVRKIGTIDGDTS